MTSYEWSLLAAVLLQATHNFFIQIYALQSDPQVVGINENAYYFYLESGGFPKPRFNPTRKLG